jgi:Protein of unknown function (DUF4241)
VTVVAAWTLAGCASGKAARVPLATTNVRCPAPSRPSSTNLHPGSPTPGTTYDLKVPKGLRRLEVVHAADLSLPTGRLVFGSGGDMGFPLERRVLDLGVAGGTYPVNLLIAEFDSGDRRVAFGELVVRTSPIVRWTGPRDLLFTTDGGDAGYESAEGSTYASTGDGQWLFDSIRYAGEHDPALLCQHVEFTDRSPLNVVIFATGWGDGVYPLALGYDEKDRIAAVITYTYVVPWRLSGLPGSPPPPVLEREAKRAG